MDSAPAKIPGGDSFAAAALGLGSDATGSIRFLERFSRPLSTTGSYPTFSLIIDRAASAAIDEATRCRDEGVSQAILFNLCGHGHFDMGAYIDYFAGKLEDNAYSEEDVAMPHGRTVESGS